MFFGYANDIAALILAKDLEKAQLTLNLVMRRIEIWMKKHSLSLALQKTEVTILTTSQIITLLPITVGTEVIQTQSSTKYLAINIDTKLNFADHIRSAANKATTATANLCRLMPNINGPKPSKRRLLLSVAQCIMLYGSEIFADELKKGIRRKPMEDIQSEGAQRIISCYKTVSA
ncbi:uncharacterized protein LOC127285313 [Leptopilina boulardi]|uniref:uncharacterized protein LOC127285313 n=1 Tax=Leptopilina boulardi TaxID=63433 RepID=UPI0021F5A088|nr:uncharacterized protein LOC127285313 [Leptopilina boulardi]